MLNNTGTISFILYGIFILITVVGMAIAFYSIKNNLIDAGKLDKIIELFKYSIISVAITTVTLIISDLFKEREQDVKELEYFDKYVQDVKKVDGIQERFQLSKYLSIVAPSGGMKKSWKEYYDSTKVEYEQYLKFKKDKQILELIAKPTTQQIIQKEQLKEKIELKEAPLVSYRKSDKQDFITAGVWEAKGFNFLFNKNVSEAINAFIESENSSNQYHEAYEISQYLKSNKEKLKDKTSSFWKTLYQKMATDFSGGMPEDIRGKYFELSKNN